jgi:hypothetical protein
MRGVESSASIRVRARMQDVAWIKGFAWTATGALVAIHAALLWRFAVDWPLHDDYTQILAVPGYMAQLQGLDEKLALLFSLTPEHRIATLRLAGWLGAALPGGLDFRLLIALGNAMAMAAGVCVVAWYPPVPRAAAALLAALLLTSLTNYGAQYWATGALQHFGVSFYALGALFALARGQRVLLPVTLALAAAFTSANGLAVFPAAVLLLGMQHRRREALAWALAGGLIVALYFVGYATPGNQREFPSLLGEPFQLASFGLATIGGVGDTFATSLAIGTLVILAWLALVATGGWRRVPPVVVAAMSFFILSCAMIAVGRAALGAEGVAIPRYRVYSGFAILLTFAALAWTIELRPLRWALSAAIAGAGVLYALAWFAMLPHVVQLSMMQAALRDHFAAEPHGHHGGFQKEFGIFTLQRARAIGAFDGTRDASPPLRMVGAMPPSGPGAGALHFELYPGERVLSAMGMLAGRHRQVDLWLDNDARAFKAGLETLRFRGGSDARQITAFGGTLSLDGVAPGRYRVGLAGEGGVGWTNERLEVR